MHMDELMPAKAVAERARVNVSTVSRWASKGALTPVLRSAGSRGHMWFRSTDVEEFLRSRDRHGSGSAA